MSNTAVSLYRRGVTVTAFLLGWLSLALLGCNSMTKRDDTAQTDPVLPAQRSVSEFVEPGATHAIDAYDPLERFNRTMYTFNAKFDEAVFLPVVGAYETVTPNLSRIEYRISLPMCPISGICSTRYCS